MPPNYNTMEPRDQDYLIEAEADRHRGNLLVHDLISLNAKLGLLAGSKAATVDQTESIAKHIVGIVHNGSSYTLPSNHATESFCTGGGRFLKREGDSWTEISDPAAVKLVAEELQNEVEFLDRVGYGKEPPPSDDKEEAKADDEEETKVSPTKDGRRDKRQKTNSGKAAAKTTGEDEEERIVTTKPNTDDVVLFDRLDSTEKTYTDHAGNGLLVLEVSQFFTEQYMLSKAVIKGTRADAALATVYSFLGSVKDVGIDGTTSTNTRFLVRPTGNAYLQRKQPDIMEVWEVLTYAQAAEFVLTLLFDKLVDKENIAAILEKAPAPVVGAPSTTGPSTTPLKNFTDHDVLFGRGGLTNTHPGNRRFRDIILLHRPDYIRAIKIEKPNVARRIVKAIRCNDPPGRFLKKNKETGMWYDVGDKHAAEKTSQALREKTQAEKAARFDEDKRKRLREGGLSQLASQRGVRMYPPLPLPALSPADLQKMVQAPYVPVAGMPGMVPPFGVPVVVPPTTNGDSKPKAKSSPNNDAKTPAAASLTATTVATAAGGEEVKIATDQERVDADGNVLVTDSDVICGRGGRSNHHIGNKRFRDIVALHRPDYVRAAKIHKPAVARMIVRALRNSDPPGRFLKKDEKTGKWYDIGDKKAAEKASQALREKTQEERDRLKNEAGVAGMPPSYFTNTALFQATAAMIKNGIPGLGSPGPALVPPAAAGAMAAAAAEAKDKEGDDAKSPSSASPSKTGEKTETAEV